MMIDAKVQMVHNAVCVATAIDVTAHPKFLAANSTGHVETSDSAKVDSIHRAIVDLAAHAVLVLARHKVNSAVEVNFEAEVRTGHHADPILIATKINLVTILS